MSKPSACIPTEIWSSRWREYADTINSIIEEWEIKSKLGVAICDNASNNDTCLQALYTALDPSKTSSDVEARRMRCFGHILNLVAQSFLYGADASSFELQSEAYTMLQQVEKDLVHWRSKGPIGKLHNVVKFIRASPQRMEAFKKHAHEHEESDVYKLSEESTAELEVRQNNATRWNSTYLMIERAWKKQSEINSFIMSLELGADPSKRVPPDDQLTPDDWKVLGEIRHMLEPIYSLTMRTQGWGEGSGHGRLWEVITGMEFILEHLEDWKALYDEEPEDFAAEMATVREGSPSSLGQSPVSTPMLSVRATQNRKQPNRQTKPPSKPHDRQIAPPSQRSSRAPQNLGRRFNQDALPEHTREEYTSATAHSVSMIASMQGRERASIRASINNAWIKLDEYYTLLGRSPLFAASVILNPGLGIRWLEASWTSSEQLLWLLEAKRDIRDYFERWYISDADLFEEEAVSVPLFTCKPEEDRFQQWVKSRRIKHSTTDGEHERYYKLEPEQVDDPIQWWMDHRSAFPRLSNFALDVLAIPAMATDCERAFSLAKLTITSQRHSMLGPSIEALQLMKN